jgi:hypothetical protein
MIFSALSSRLHGFGPHLAGLRRRYVFSMSLCSAVCLLATGSRNHRSAPLRQCAIFSCIFKLICPVQPRPQKYSTSSRPQITSKTPAIPSREEGRWPSSRTLGRVAVDAAASGAGGVRRAVIRERTRRAGERRLNAFARSLVGGTGWPNGLAEEAAYGKTVWFWHPWLVSSWRRFAGAQPGDANRQFAGDGGKRNSSPGRARHKP